MSPTDIVLAVVVRAGDFQRLEEPDEQEEDMLDLAFGLTNTSRLACQIIMTEKLDGLTVSVPSATRNIDIDEMQEPAPCKATGMDQERP